MRITYIAQWTRQCCEMLSMLEMPNPAVCFGNADAEHAQDAEFRGFPETYFCRQHAVTPTGGR